MRRGGTRGPTTTSLEAGRGLSKKSARNKVLKEGNGGEGGGMSKIVGLAGSTQILLRRESELKRDAGPIAEARGD